MSSQDQFRHINSLFFSAPSSNKQGKKSEQLAEEPEAIEEKNENVPGDIILKRAWWEPGVDGFQYNKACILVVEAEFLKKTNLVRVEGKLNVTCNEIEEDLGMAIEGSLDQTTGIARCAVKYLALGKNHAKAWSKDPLTPSSYQVKGIKNAASGKKINSEILEMPFAEKIEVCFLSLGGVHFPHSCALPCLDENGTLISALATTLSFAQKHPTMELIVEGHADKSGKEEYNLRISQRRAQAVKALLDDDVSLWQSVAQSNKKDHTIEVEDYQQCLRSLAVYYHWSCDPGAVDNIYGPETKAAVQSFQTEYNGRFPANEPLDVDGAFGEKCWVGLFYVLRNFLGKALKTLEIDPKLKCSYGYQEGQGVYPCGESTPLTTAENSGKDRRVELVFYTKGDAIPPQPPDAKRKTAQKNDSFTAKAWKKIEIPLQEIPPPGLIRLNLSWDEDIVDLLPPETKIVLSAAELGKNERLLHAGQRESGLVAIHFQWENPDLSTTLVAVSSSKQLILWKDHVIGDGKKAPPWEHALEELITPKHPEQEDDTEYLSQSIKCQEIDDCELFGIEDGEDDSETAV